MLNLKRIFKTLWRYKTSSALSLISLIISFTGIIILTLFVSFEKSYDNFHENKETIYELSTKNYGCWLPATMSPIIAEKIPEVEAATPIYNDHQNITTRTLEKSNTKFGSDIYYVNNHFFDIFSFPLTLGNSKTALIAPHSAVLSEKLSQKLFNGKNPIDQSIIIDGSLYKVKAVMKDFPKNSTLEADCLLSFSSHQEDENLDFFTSNIEWSFCNILKLSPNSNPELVAEKIEQIPEISENIEEIKNQYNKNETFLTLVNLKKIHYISDDFFSYTNPLIIKVLIFLIVILALMGAVNFINFSTSQAPLRAKALSVFRVLGSKRISTMAQIILESVAISTLAMVISFIIYSYIHKLLSAMFNIQGLALTNRYYFLWLFFAFAIVFGVLAAFYPSKYITSPPISQTIKGNVLFRGKGKRLRNALIVLQFAFTIALISSSLIIEKQLDYWRNFDLGINKKHVVYLKTTEELRNHYQAFANELIKDNNIQNYTYAQFIPGKVGMTWGREIDDKYVQFKCWPVDNRFLDFFDIEISSGRKFSKNAEADINNFILNEKAVELFAWEKPIEQKFEGFSFEGQVVGVANNFNFSSLKSNIPALAFWFTNTRKNVLLLRLSPGNYTQTLSHIKDVALQFDPKNPVEVTFLDDSLNKLYTKEERIARFIEFVAIWCILLSIVGMLGMVIFISRDRVKEIGVRKVNGAKVSEILTMLNKDFVKWVAIAFVIATPIAYYAMHKWLENFAYKTELSWWIFALPGGLALGIALLTVSWQSWKAATRNPVEALRYE